MSNRQTIGQALKCFADPGKRQDYFRLYSDDIVLHGYRGVEPGLESVKQFYNAFWEVFPDAQVTVHELIAEDDTLVVRYVITGMQKKNIYGRCRSRTTNRASRYKHFALQKWPMLRALDLL